MELQTIHDYDKEITDLMEIEGIEKLNSEDIKKIIIELESINKKSI